VLASDILQVLGIVFQILTFIVLIRVLISWIPGLNLYHPLVRLIRAIADPILAPFRGLLPSFGGMLDISPVLAFIVLQLAAEVCFSLASEVGLTGVSLAAILVAALEQLVLTLIIIVAVLVLLRFLLSLFHADPWHPLTRGIKAMSKPFVQPFDGIVTSHSSIDVEALFACVAYIVVFLIAKFALDWLVGLV
jgi:YggT family protein